MTNQEKKRERERKRGHWQIKSEMKEEKLQLTHTGGKIVPSVICIEHPAGAPGHQVSSAKYHMHGAVIKIRSIIPSNSALVNSSHELAS